MQIFKDLTVYKKAYKLALDIYKLSIKLSKKIQFNLVDQIRRSTKSIPANITEGYSKKSSQKEFRRFILIAMGSKDETLVHLDFLKDLNYIDQETYDNLYSDYEEIGKMFYSFMNKLES